MTIARSMVARRPGRRATGWMFVLPFFLFLVAFGIIPVIWALVTAFQVTPVIGSGYFSLTQNFTDVFADQRFGRSVANVALYLVLWLPVLLFAVFLIALVLDAKRTRFASATRFIAYVPGAITGSASAVLWVFMFTPGVSPVGFLLAPFADSDGAVISDQSLPVLLTIMGIAVGAGGWVVFLYGALTAIPSDILEAATIDGAGPLGQVLWVKLPMIRRYIAFILIVSLANGFQLFVEPSLLGIGAKGRIDSTWSINQLVYSYAASASNYGRASALAVLLLAVTITAAVVIITRTRFYRIED